MSEARDRLRAMRHEAQTHLGIAARIYALATEALAEADAEIMRLKDELAEAENRKVLHATGAQCERIIASGEADDEEFGTLLRSTDDSRTWEMMAAGWQLR